MLHIPLDRRRFLGACGLGLVAGPGLLHASLFGPPRRLRLLVLGGTSFVGPYIVTEALARGHRVTLFNRGITNPDLFPEVEALRGDRLADGGLDALGADRTWDAVVDTWQGSPVAVARSTATLSGRVGHYAYVSSIAVYGSRNYRVPGVDERAPLPTTGPPPTDPAVELPYPARKAHAEGLVQRAFPGAHSLHRAHGIVGVDTRGRLDNPEIGIAGKAWWPVRVARGGEVLAPGSPHDTTQYTDVTDLGRFVVHCLEAERTGPFNVCATHTLRDFLAALREEARSDAEFTWIDAAFLTEQGLESFTEIPLWVSHGEVEGAFFQISTHRALSAGLRLRTIGETFGPVRRSFLAHHTDFDLGNDRDGIELARRETELLRSWRARQQGLEPQSEP